MMYKIQHQLYMEFISMTREIYLGADIMSDKRKIRQRQ